MLVIRTAEEMARALSSSLDPPLKERLEAQRDHLLDYPDYAFEELGLFVISWITTLMPATRTRSSSAPVTGSRKSVNWTVPSGKTSLA